ncbi:hypothetical protein SAMN04487890_1229 [Mucilaginibacter polytrichastri]|nr:hypothetical protein SAMN04487890_1229 [Mucilaginibacter polytrichastri]
MAKRVTTIIGDLLENNEKSKLFSNRYILSVHSHWLSEEEADEAFKILGIKDYRRLIDIEIKIIEFLVELNKIYKLTYFDKSEAIMYDFWDDGEFIKKAADGLREVTQFVFYAKSLDLILISGFDQDIRIFFISDGDQSPFKNLVYDNKLYLLE